MDKILWYRMILGDIFQLKYIPHVVRKSRIIWPGKIPCWGMYYGEYVGKRIHHRIEYNYKTDDKTIFTTLAHEYVHAWQMENGLELEHSEQKQFREWEDYFKTHFDLDLQFRG